MSDTLETSEGWSSDIELICKNVAANSIQLSKIHKKRYLQLTHQQIYYKIPIIVFSAVNSIFSVGLSAYVNQSIVSTTNCIISLFCGILSSIELYFQISKKMESELLTHREFYLLSIKIQSCLKLERHHRQELSGVNFLTEILNTYNSLIESSNIINEEYTDELQLIQIVYPPNNPLGI